MATQTLAVPEEKKVPKVSLSQELADQYGLEPQKFLETVKATVFPGGQASNEQLAAFLIVARQYGLNPFVREIYAFPGRGSGVVPIVSIDGWTRIINRQSMLDGIEFHDRMNSEGKLSAITCRIFRKDRSKPTEVTEYMAECTKDTDPWKKWPARMLRHKALIQCARYAFSLNGIFDEDEAERIAEGRPHGEIELAPDSPLRNITPQPVGNGNGQTEALPEVRNTGVPDPTVKYKVGKFITTITGNVTKLARDMKTVQGRPDEQGNWTIPANMTHEFVTLCEKRGIAVAEELVEEEQGTLAGL